MLLCLAQGSPALTPVSHSQGHYDYPGPSWVDLHVTCPNGKS